MKQVCLYIQIDQKLQKLCHNLGVIQKKKSFLNIFIFQIVDIVLYKNYSNHSNHKNFYKFKIV